MSYVLTNRGDSRIIGYVDYADLSNLCPDCASKRPGVKLFAGLGADDAGANHYLVRAGGNNIVPVYNWQDDLRGYFCDDCHDPIDPECCVKCGTSDFSTGVADDDGSGLVCAECYLAHRESEGEMELECTVCETMCFLGFAYISPDGFTRLCKRCEDQRQSDREAFAGAYVAAALWSECDDEGLPLDIQYTSDDIDPDSLRDARMEAMAWYDANHNLWAAATYEYRGSINMYGPGQAGHDFWLTRNGHGAGFWDRGLENSDLLSVLARGMGEANLLIGDDGRLYFFGVTPYVDPYAIPDDIADDHPMVTGRTDLGVCLRCGSMERGGPDCVCEYVDTPFAATDDDSDDPTSVDYVPSLRLDFIEDDDICLCGGSMPCADPDCVAQPDGDEPCRACGVPFDHLGYGLNGVCPSCLDAGIDPAAATAVEPDDDDDGFEFRADHYLLYQEVLDQTDLLYSDEHTTPGDVAFRVQSKRYLTFLIGLDERGHPMQKLDSDTIELEVWQSTISGRMEIRYRRQYETGSAIKRGHKAQVRRYKDWGSIPYVVQPVGASPLENIKIVSAAFHRPSGPVATD